MNDSGGTDLVLVVDDDPGIRQLLISALGFVGFAVAAAGDLTGALAQVARRSPDVIVLDVMLPGADGFEILRLLRDRGVTVPVLFLTARDAVEDRVRGLRLGGDDYVTKGDPGWAWPSWRRSSTPTTAGSRWSPPSASAPRSPSVSRAGVRIRTDLFVAPRRTHV